MELVTIVPCLDFSFYFLIFVHFSLATTGMELLQLKKKMKPTLMAYSMLFH